MTWSSTCVSRTRKTQTVTDYFLIYVNSSRIMDPNPPSVLAIMSEQSFSRHQCVDTCVIGLLATFCTHDSSPGGPFLPVKAWKLLSTLVPSHLTPYKNPWRFLKPKWLMWSFRTTLFSRKWKLPRLGPDNNIIAIALRKDPIPHSATLGLSPGPLRPQKLPRISQLIS